jgi:hypothetical protein
MNDVGKSRGGRGADDGNLTRIGDGMTEETAEGTEGPSHFAVVFAADFSNATLLDAVAA